MEEKLSYEELQKKYKVMQDAYFQLKRKYINAVRELDHRNEQLAEHHKELSDSINYALRIQRAILPPDYYVTKSLPKSFILYMPKDIVSGDFYFVEKLDNKVVFSAVDCTGHGVPGAMMSVIGFKYLEQAVNEKKLTSPAAILQFLDIGVNDSLRQTAGESGVKDGMDLGICTIDIESLVLQYAGSYNPLYIVPRDISEFLANNPHINKTNGRVHILKKEKNCLFEIKADRLPIGVNEDGVADIFTNHSIQLSENDAIYLFSDGYADQFGGEFDKKFMYTRMKELILSMTEKTMKEQHHEMVKTIKNWMNDHYQIDDILVMGVRV